MIMYIIAFNDNGTGFVIKDDILIADNIPAEKIHYIMKQMIEETKELENYKRAVGEN